MNATQAQDDWSRGYDTGFDSGKRAGVAEIRDQVADLIEKYGQAKYEAGVARDPRFTHVEHAERIDKAHALYCEILSVLFHAHEA